jgi:hypothetical protein
LKRNICLTTHIVLLLFVMQAMAGAQQPSQSQAGNATAGQVNDADLQQMREEHRSQRKKIVAANLPLTDTEATRFWPVYDRYRNEAAATIYDVRYSLIKDYAQNYNNMTEDQADSFMTRWLALDSDSAQLQGKYVPEFEKVISHKKTAMFFQIDRRVTMMFDLQLAGQIPLVKP